ncbi:MAG: hypothetical protein ACK441_02940, partial [Burkholderiales bacterium]
GESGASASAAAASGRGLEAKSLRKIAKRYKAMLMRSISKRQPPMKRHFLCVLFSGNLRYILAMLAREASPKI